MQSPNLSLMYRTEEEEGKKNLTRDTLSREQSKTMPNPGKDPNAPPTSHTRLQLQSEGKNKKKEKEKAIEPEFVKEKQSIHTRTPNDSSWCQSLGKSPTLRHALSVINYRIERD